MHDIIELQNKEIKKKLFCDITYFSIAESGAMGEPGGVIFINNKGQKYHFNYVFGDVDIEKVEKAFPVLAECEFGMFGENGNIPNGWNYVYLGMGNHLIVNDSVYIRFKEMLGDIEDPAEIYAKWQDIADSILSAETSLYEGITCYIDKLKSDSIGEWVTDKENDGSREHPIQMPFVGYSSVVRSFEKAVYEFEENHPEFNLNKYGEILESHGISWEEESMSEADVSALDGQAVMALMMGAIRAERFCDGALMAFFKNGSIERWLIRLKEIDGK